MINQKKWVTFLTGKWKICDSNMEKGFKSNPKNQVSVWNVKFWQKVFKSNLSIFKFEYYKVGRFEHTAAVSTFSGMVWVSGYQSVFHERKNPNEVLRIVCLVKEELLSNLEIRFDLMSCDFPSIWLELRIKVASFGCTNG